MFCALCQGLFYLDKFGEAAVLCVCVYVLEWALINMDEYTSRCLWKPTCPIMFKDIPFITWESRNSQLSGNDLQLQSTDFFLLLILYIFVYPGKTNVCLDANGLTMFVLNVKVDPSFATFACSSF